MKVILLAGGSSKRFQKFGCPNKMLWKIKNKEFILLQLEKLLEFFDEKDIIVVAGREIYDFVKKHHKNLVLQPEPKGMGDAVLRASPREPFLLIGASDYLEISKDIINKFTEDEVGKILAYKVKKYFPGGYIILKDKRIREIIEKPGKMISNLVNLVFHYHPRPALLLEEIKRQYEIGGKDDEYERALSVIFKEIIYIPITFEGVWIPIKYPGDFLRLAKHLNSLIHGKVINSELKNTYVGQGAVVLNSKLENCVVCPGARVENIYAINSIIGDKVYRMVTSY